MEINVENLISAIYKRPVLWDQTNKNYHNRIVVEKNWKDIAEELETPKDCLKKKWKNIRDQFRNECKKIPVAKSGDCGISLEDCKTYISWPHFKSLLFLKDQMRSRKSVRNSKYAPELSINEESSDEIISEEIRECDSEEVNYKPKKKSAKLNVSAELLAIEQQKLVLLEKKVNTQKETDDDVAFFDSILPYMRIMDLKEKLKCRMVIQKVIYSHCFGEDAQGAPPTQL